jgi:hypothetical protein
VDLAFRRARPEEAAALTALALRSKRRWGYYDAFMAAAAADMQITPQLIVSAVTVVAERGGAILGFYVLSIEPDGPTLRDLWVEPIAIGTGAALWAHMLTTARDQRLPTVRLSSDPNAAGFYARMGARQIGEVPSCVVLGRVLPLFEVDVPPPARAQ